METILKLRDICKAHDKCFNGCPLYDNGECLVCIPPANLDDEQLYLIGKALKGEECQLVRSVEALSYAKAELKAAYDRAEKIGLKEKTRYIIVLEMAIKVLEQEPVLDKIRAEIENDWQIKKYPSSPFSCGLRRAIEIIDKYKAETEAEDGNNTKTT